MDQAAGPLPRLRATQWGLRALLVLSFGALLWWAAWVFDPSHLAVPSFFAVVVAAQVLDFFAVLGFWHAIWPRRRPQPTFAAVRGRGSILILTRDQPIQVVEQTLQAAVAVRHRHRVFLADPRQRPELGWLAGWYGVRRLSPEMEELDEIAGARFLAVIDAGQVPRPEFLERLLPHFADRNLALVQAWCGLGQRRGVRDAILRGGDALDEAGCLASNYVLRRSALYSVGGFGPGATSLAGALRLAAALRADQWRTRYVSERLTDSLRRPGPLARLAEGRRRAAAQLGVALLPGSRHRGVSPSAKFHAAWTGLRYPALLGLPVSLVALAAYATLEPLQPTWVLNLAQHLVPYLVLRTAVRLVVAAGRPAQDLPALQPGVDVVLPEVGPPSTEEVATDPVMEPEAPEPAPASEPELEPALDPTWAAELERQPGLEAEPETPDLAPAEPEPGLEPAAMADVESQQETEPETQELFTLLPELEPEPHLGWKAMSSPETAAASEPELVAPASEQQMELEPTWNVLSLLDPEAARQKPRRRSGVAVAAWVVTVGAIGAAAFAVIQSNPPQRPASVQRVSTPPYSYYAPVPAPPGGGQP